MCFPCHHPRVIKCGWCYLPREQIRDICPSDMNVPSKPSVTQSDEGRGDMKRIAICRITWIDLALKKPPTWLEIRTVFSSNATILLYWEKCVKTRKYRAPQIKVSSEWSNCYCCYRFLFKRWASTATVDKLPLRKECVTGHFNENIEQTSYIAQCTFMKHERCTVIFRIYVR